MTPAEFEPALLAGEELQSNAFDSPDAWIGCFVLLLLLLLFTSIELSLGGSSPYTSTDSCHSVAAVLTPVQTVVTRW
jgi:hypothetical protein